MDGKDHISDVSFQPTQELNIEMTPSRNLARINFLLKPLAFIFSFLRLEWRFQVMTSSSAREV